jgi:hypothetical protein
LTVNDLMANCFIASLLPHPLGHFQRRPDAFGGDAQVAGCSACRGTISLPAVNDNYFFPSTTITLTHGLAFRWVSDEG